MDRDQHGRIQALSLLQKGVILNLLPGEAKLWPLRVSWRLC